MPSFEGLPSCSKASKILAAHAAQRRIKLAVADEISRLALIITKVRSIKATLGPNDIDDMRDIHN